MLKKDSGNKYIIKYVDVGSAFYCETKGEYPRLATLGYFDPDFYKLIKEGQEENVVRKRMQLFCVGRVL